MSQLRRKPRQGQIDSSKDWLAKAYIELLGTKEDKGIRISDIANRAGVSRQTLYRHFISKEEILDWYLEDKFKIFLDICNNSESIIEAHRDNIKLVFKFCKDEIKFITTLIELKKEGLLLDKIDVFTNRIEPLIFPNNQENNLYYKKKAFSGALFHLIISWIKKGAIDDPILFSSIIEKMLG